MKKNRVLLIVKVGTFLGIFLVLLFLLQEILVAKWIYTENEETRKYESFYELERDSLDYIVLGTSTGYHSINPMQIYAETGIKGYDLGSPRQGIKLSYYWLKEATKYQTPKYVFFEASALLHDTTLSSEEKWEDTALTSALTDMRFSINKVNASIDCETENKKALEILVPILAFHTRWEDLTETDFSFGTNYYALRGTFLSFSSRNDSNKMGTNGNIWNTYTIEGIDKVELGREIQEEHKQIFLDIYSYCRLNGMELIPISGGTKRLSDNDKQKIKKFLNSYGLEYLDIGTKITGLDWNYDTADAGYHVNYWGNSKYSHILADYLKARDFDKNLKEVDEALWNDDLIEYQSFEEQKLTNNKEKVLSYLNTLTQNKEELYIILSVRDEACGGWNEELDYYIRKLGLESDFRNNIQNSCIAVVDGGNCVFEQWAENKMILEDSIVLNEKKKKLSVTSAGFVYGDTATIKLDSTNYSVSSRGLNIVAVEKATGKVISSVAIDTHIGDSAIKVKELDDYATMKWKEYQTQAQQIPDGIYSILPSNNTQCALDIEEGSTQEDANLALWTRTEEIPQQFEVEHVGNGLYYIKALCSDKYLTAYNYGNTNGTNVVQNSFTGLANQKWFIYESGEGVYTIMSHYNKLVMDVSGTVSEPGVDIQLYEENDGEWQKFVFSSLGM